MPDQGVIVRAQCGGIAARPTAASLERPAPRHVKLRGTTHASELCRAAQLNHHTRTNLRIVKQGSEIHRMNRQKEMNLLPDTSLLQEK